VKDKPGYNPAKPCPNSYEYMSQDASEGRPEWVIVLKEPVLPNGQAILPDRWRND
jgi:hypothetical protein